MEVHKLLKRQLDNLKIAMTQKPETDEQWQAFLERVNNTYMDADQERYLHERSMGISSREMMNLNKKLEHAQHIAGLGYWSYDGNTGHTLWSNELFALFHLDPFHKPPSYDEFIKLVYEQDRFEFTQKMERALNERIDYECDIRVRNPEGEYRWYRTIGQCLNADKQLSGIIIDIHKNKVAEEKIKELNQQISSAARRAGMAEVATNILHNIGNILNSSNVSITLLKNSMKQDFHKKLVKTLEIIEQHQTDLAHFFSTEPKGMIIPKYLLALSKVILEEDEKNGIEIDSLTQDLQHINQIVNMQKSISGISSLNEQVYLPDLIETALHITLNTSQKRIELIKEFKLTPLLVIDKSKLLQILINLIQNAKDAVLENKSTLIKEIKISIQNPDKNSIQLSVADNGVGINVDNLQHIFAFGFTTKKNGHGFGLHSSALSARELGGSLIAESQGEGYGAQFILTLPIVDNLEEQGEIDE